MKVVGEKKVIKVKILCLGEFMGLGVSWVDVGFVSWVGGEGWRCDFLEKVVNYRLFVDWCFGVMMGGIGGCGGCMNLSVFF